MDYLKAACRHLEITAGQVRKFRVEGDNVVLVVDRGIAGCPKFTIPISELPVVKEKAPPAAPLVEAPYAVDVTPGARRLAAREGVDLVEVAQAVKGARITVRTLKERA